MTKLNEKSIDHFRGCNSFTQNYEIEGNSAVVLINKPNDLEPLLYNNKKLRKQTDIRTEALAYEIPCV